MAAGLTPYQEELLAPLRQQFSTFPTAYNGRYNRVNDDQAALGARQPLPEDYKLFVLAIRGRSLPSGGCEEHYLRAAAHCLDTSPPPRADQVDPAVYGPTFMAPVKRYMDRWVT